MGAHVDNSTKAQILGAIDYLESQKITHSKSRIFEQFGVSRTTGWRILRQGKDKKTHYEPEPPETRGRKKLLSPTDLKLLEQLVWRFGFEAQSLSWQGLLAQAGLGDKISMWSVRRALGTLDYRRCIVCQASWVSPFVAEKRLKGARDLLQRWPRPEDWRDKRFSGEIHFSLGPEGKAKIIRKPGERPCPDCTQEESRTAEEKHVKRLHAWAAVGYNFVSDLYFYEVDGSQHSAMGQEVYTQQILEGPVKTWLAEGQSFYIEDGDSGFCPSKQTLVKSWREENNVEFYLNPPGSPDMTVMDNCWRLPKARIGWYQSLDVDQVKHLTMEAWSNLQKDPSRINRWVDSMPQRLTEVIEAEGRITRH